MHKAIRLADVPGDGKLETRRTRKPRTQEVREFLQSDDEAWEMIDPDLPTHSLYSSISSVLRQNQYFGRRLRVLERRGRVFLVRKE